jgi:hypothetical protein
VSALFICFAKSLDIQIEELNRAGKKGRIAAATCLEILEQIRKDGLTGELLFIKRTKKGEARVDKCVKYDLGNGYRLITILCKDHLFIPFAGTHDKADLWLEHNRLDNIYKKKELYMVEKINYEQQQFESVCETSMETSFCDEYEEGLLERIDDDTLRQVFRGLVEQR